MGKAIPGEQAPQRHTALQPSPQHQVQLKEISDQANQLCLAQQGPRSRCCKRMNYRSSYLGSCDGRQMQESHMYHNHYSGSFRPLAD